MLNLIRALLFAALTFFQTRRQLAAEILALRHQLGVLERSVRRFVAEYHHPCHHPNRR